MRRYVGNMADGTSTSSWYREQTGGADKASQSGIWFHPCKVSDLGGQREGHSNGQTVSYKVWDVKSTGPRVRGVLKFHCTAWTFHLTFKPRGRVKAEILYFQSFWIVNDTVVLDLDLKTITFKSKVFQKEEFSSNGFKVTFSEEEKKLLV